jgi:hypothetical protein
MTIARGRDECFVREGLIKNHGSMATAIPVSSYVCMSE